MGVRGAATAMGTGALVDGAAALLTAAAVGAPVLPDSLAAAFLALASAFLAAFFAAGIVQDE
jgi:hypothetical protein